MDNEQAINLGMTSSATYQITIIGRLDKGWEDWFTSTQKKFEESQAGRPLTTLNCRIRDQSELLGVLNRLNSLNFPLYSVRLINKEVEKRGLPPVF